MGWMRRGGWMALSAAGYVLSPLSWWNDLYVNLPISYLVANGAYCIHPRLFMPAMVGAYWLTNVIGLALMHAGAVRASKDGAPAPDWRGTVKWVLFSLLYTGAVLALWKLGLLRPAEEYIRAAGARHGLTR